MAAEQHTAAEVLRSRKRRAEGTRGATAAVRMCCRLVHGADMACVTVRTSRILGYLARIHLEHRSIWFPSHTSRASQQIDDIWDIWNMHLVNI